MTQFVDPRTQPGFKNKPITERAMLLMGAILDQLVASNVPSVPTEPVRRQKREKAE